MAPSDCYLISPRNDDQLITELTSKINVFCFFLFSACEDNFTFFFFGLFASLYSQRGKENDYQLV